MRHSLQQRNVQDLSAKQVTAWSRNGSVKTKKRKTPTKTRNKTYPSQFCTISNRTTTKRSRTRRRASLSTKTHRCQFRWALATRWTASHRASATPTPKNWHFAELFADTTAKVQIGKKSEHDDVYEDEQLSLCGENQLPRPRHVWQVKPYLLLFPKIVPAVWMVWFPRKAELSRPTRLSGLVFAPERLICLDSFRVRQVQKNVQRERHAHLRRLTALLQQPRRLSQDRSVGKDEGRLHRKRHQNLERRSQPPGGEHALPLARHDWAWRWALQPQPRGLWNAEGSMRRRAKPGVQALPRGRRDKDQAAPALKTKKSKVI